MNYSIGLTLALLVSACTLFGQSLEIGGGTVEVAGNILFSSSTLSRTSTMSYHPEELETRTYTWVLQSEVDVFVLGYLELGASVEYSRTRTEAERPKYPMDYISNVGYSSSSALAVAFGPSYNLPLGRRVWTFVKIRAGVYWTNSRYGEDTPYPEELSRTQTLVPVVQGGFKFFLSQGAAIVVQVQYDRLSETKRRTTTFGAGLAVYL